MHHVVIGDYFIYRQIGKGAFSDVYYGVNRITGTPVAIKKIVKDSLSAIEIDTFNKEISIIKNLNHPNIVKYYDNIIVRKKNTIYIITEYCDVGDLSVISSDNFTKDKSPLKYENEVKYYFSQVRDGLAYLYENHIIHRDLKPKNILLKKYVDSNGNSKMIAKIVDFGLARYFSEEATMLRSLCGSPFFMASEILLYNKPTLVSDLWSFGVIMYQMLYHKDPFGKPENIIELINKIRDDKIEYPTLDNGKVSDEAVKLMRQLLQADPTKRICWNDFICHSWFLKYDPDCKNSRQSMENQRIDDQSVGDQESTDDKEQFKDSDSLTDSSDSDEVDKLFFDLDNFKTISRRKHSFSPGETSDDNNILLGQYDTVENYFDKKKETLDIEEKMSSMYVGSPSGKKGVEIVDSRTCKQNTLVEVPIVQHSTIYKYLNDSITSFTESFSFFKRHSY